MPLSKKSRFIFWLCNGALLGCLFSCNSSRINSVDESGESAADGSTMMPGGSGDMSARIDRCGEGLPCASGRICYENTCVIDRGPCCQDDDCQNDTHCTVKTGGAGSCGHCVDYHDGEYDPQCIGNGFSATDFQSPADRCKWPKPGTTPVASDVVMTPIVVDLDLDGQPEIVFTAQNMSGPARLIAMRGKDCTQLYDVAANLQGFSQLAAADLDGDKYPEIVGLLANGTNSGGHVVAVFEGRTGTKLAQSKDNFTMTGASFDCSGPAIGDLDGDGRPEIVAGGLVVRWNKATGQLDKVWHQPVEGAQWGTMSLINDFDGDGKPEVVAGNHIFDGVMGTEKTPSALAEMTGGGYTAVGDFNKDGAPDLVFVRSMSMDEKVAVIDVRNNKFLLGPLVIPNGWGGPPTVADFDGDGVPDFGSAGPRNYFVFSLDCLKTPKPAKCRGSLPGVLWQSVTKDVSSGGTASSVFDFNGDGRAEVVYRDECWLRVYNGPDGTTVFARPITSGTALEMPIVADVDSDGHADLIVPSDSIQANGYCMDHNPEHDTGMAHTGVTQGVFVLKDPMNRWMPSRPMWNQHTYHITNINDDASVPPREPPNWARYNNYRQNVQGAISILVPQSDVTGKGSPTIESSDCVAQWKLSAQVCNRGAAPVAPKIPATFYAKDPRIDPQPICTVQTDDMPIQPGHCQTVSCIWPNPPTGAVDLWFRANDDGKNARPQTQCKNLNDLAFFPGAVCYKGPG